LPGAPARGPAARRAARRACELGGARGRSVDAAADMFLDFLQRQVARDNDY